MDIVMQLATINNIDELEQLYNDLNDYLEKNINYPGWKKGVYPVRQNAIDGINSNDLFIAKYDDRIIGSIILKQEPEEEYKKAKWEFESDYSDVFVIHTLTVHPEHLHCGVGKKLIDFAVQYGKNKHMKSLRLDVYEKNQPAIQLYEKSGFKYIDTIDLGYSSYGLDWFKLYEKVL